MKNLGLLVIRLVVGGLLAGHGAQKLFGWFNGPGPRGTAGFMEMLGLQPGGRWGMMAGLSEFGGGVLTALGLFNPLGPVGIISAMSMATAKVHWGKPIWAGEGGPELPLTNVAAALGVAAAGPGALSLDNAFGIKIPRWITAIAYLSAAASVAYGVLAQPAPAQPSQQEAATGAEEAKSSENPIENS